MRLYGIAAIGNNKQIGLNGKLPWENHEELQHFKKETSGHILIMGRKTYESIGKPLKGRKTIVISNKISENGKELYTVNSPETAYALATFIRNEGQKVFVCGGQQIYEHFLSQIHQLTISKMDYKGLGDTFFPNFEDNFNCMSMERNRIGKFNVEMWERVK